MKALVLVASKNFKGECNDNTTKCNEKLKIAQRFLSRLKNKGKITDY